MAIQKGTGSNILEEKLETFHWKTEKRPEASGNKLFERNEKHLDTFIKYMGGIVDMAVKINDYIGNIAILGDEKFF